MSLKSQVEAFLNRYKSDFETLEAERIAAYYNVPFFGMNGIKALAFTTTEIVLENFRNVTKEFRAAGLAQARYELQPLNEVSSSILEIPVHWTLLRADGSLLTKMRVVYVVWRQPDDWKITVVYGVE